MTTIDLTPLEARELLDLVISTRSPIFIQHWRSKLQPICDSVTPSDHKLPTDFSTTGAHAGTSKPSNIPSVEAKTNEVG